MSELTEQLQLFKYTEEDGKETFSLEKALNQNWDKIDEFARNIDQIFDVSFSQVLDKKVFNDINTELSKKLEAEVLLEENGYIKFNNGLTITFSLLNKINTYLYPISYSKFVYPFTTCFTSAIGYTPSAWIMSYDLTQCYLKSQRWTNASYTEDVNVHFLLTIGV